MKLNHLKLKQKREDALLSQENMAYLLGINQSIYNRIENGKTKLKMEHVPHISKIFNAKPEEILKELTGCNFNNSITEHAENNQNIGIQINQDQLMADFLKEKQNTISLQQETIQVLKITITVLQDEIERLKTM